MNWSFLFFKQSKATAKIEILDLYFKNDLAANDSVNFAVDLNAKNVFTFLFFY